MVGLIVARSKNNVIGKNGQIPWRIKGEQKQFKELTTGNAIVMGRKAYEEIGHPLPNRLNVIVSRTKKFEGENLITASSVSSFLVFLIILRPFGPGANLMLANHVPSLACRDGYFSSILSFLVFMMSCAVSWSIIPRSSRPFNSDSAPHRLSCLLSNHISSPIE